MSHINICYQFKFDKKNKIYADKYSYLKKYIRPNQTLRYHFTAQ